MRARRVRAMALKEVRQIVRDVRSLIAAIVIPLVMIFLFGYALSLDVDDIGCVVLDADHTSASRGLVERMVSSGYFRVARYIASEREIDPALQRREASCALVIPEGFGRAVKRGKEASVQVIFDGTDANTTTIASGYFQGVAAGFNLDELKKRLAAAGLSMGAQPVAPRIRVWFNPELKSRNFIIPGLTGVLMMVICALLTALTISREKETGTLEQLISTPVTSGEMIVGKLLPYIVIGFIDMALVVLSGIFVFMVPFRGSVWVLLLGSAIFLTGTLGWGLFISANAKNQLESSQMVVLSAFLPSFLLSGFIYPIENMPLALQAITLIIPARYFIEILKGVFLKGVGIGVLWPQFVFLTVYALVVLRLAAQRFSKRIA